MPFRNTPEQALPEDIVQNPLLNFLVSPRMRVYRHLVPWLLFLLLPDSDTKEYRGGSEVIIGLGVLALFMSVIYTNMYLLVPKLLFRKHYIGYFAIVIGVVVLSFFILETIDKLILSGYRILPAKDENVGLWEGMFTYTLLFCIVVSASTAVRLFQRWVLDSYRINEMEKRRLQSELDQLKNQINPHFLFNMLNNANVLTHKDPEKASQVLMKLSDLLRYQLYDSMREKVLLTSDIHFLTNLLELEQIRRDRFEYMVSREGNISSIMIPPFLFVIFVENAVKHNLDAQNASFVQLFFKVERQRVYFKCVNSRPVSMPASDKVGGLGLMNVKRRLELIYPGTHELDIRQQAETYTVTLAIPI
nr:histidine kinase [uncultured Dyadobacter sp.]